MSMITVKGNNAVKRGIYTICVGNLHEKYHSYKTISSEVRTSHEGKRCAYNNRTFF